MIFPRNYAAALMAAALMMAATPALSGWMAYSVDGRAKFRHGLTASQQAARQAAMNSCGNSKCWVVDVTADKCTALAVSQHNGCWIGMGAGPNKASTIEYAIGWCANNAPTSTCSISHSYCQ